MPTRRASALRYALLKPQSIPRPVPSTTARLSLGDTRAAPATGDHLRFRLDHALARDAVQAALDVPLIEAALRERNLTPVHLRSAAPDRAAYLRRPDLGRTLNPESVAALKCAVGPIGARRTGEEPASPAPGATRVALMFADGLSALAAERHALPLLDATLPLISDPLPVVTVLTNARVTLGDEIGQILRADITVLLIGERPGLSSPDSLGCYITWSPRAGRTDAERNCISNIRGDDGLGYTEAAHRIAHYVREAARLQATGITLKDPAAPKSVQTGCPAQVHI